MLLSNDGGPRGASLFDVENATTVMETEYVEEAREGRIKLPLPVALDSVQDNGGDLGSFSAESSVNTARTRHDHLKVDLITDVSHSLLTALLAGKTWSSRKS